MPDGHNAMQSEPDAGFALGIRVLVYAFIILIPLVLFFRFNFLPFDDCLRHAAKAVSGRSWADILVLREGISLDQHPGWHMFLRVLSLCLGMGKEQLVFVEWTVLFILVSVIVIPFFRRPEAWVAAMLLACLALPENYMFSLTRVRPYLLKETILLLNLVLWGRSGKNPLTISPII